MCTICRVCLISNVKTQSLANSPLKAIYEKLTNFRLHTDERPETVCFICHWKLAQCNRFKDKLHKSTKILTQLQEHGIEIVPDTISVLCRSVQPDFLVTPVETFTYSPIQHISPKIEIKEEPSNPTENIDFTGAVEKLCLVCLSHRTSTYSGLGRLEGIYEKITDTKFIITNDNLGVCVLCRARLRSCRELITKANKSERIIDELAKNGIQMTPETVNILNKKIKLNYSTSGVEIFSLAPFVEKEKIKIEKSYDTVDKPTIKKELNEINHNEMVHKYTEQNIEDLNDSDQDFRGFRENYTQNELNEKEKNRYNDESQFNLDKDDQDKNFDLDKSEKSDRDDLSNKDIDEIKSKKKHIQKLPASERLKNCKICGLKFRTWYSQIQHMPLHDIERKFRCTQCSYRYKNRYRLEEHRRITHGGIFRCKVCGKKHSSSRNLNMHMHAHTGDRKYKCEICDKYFVQGKELSYHNRKKHPHLKPIKCKFCKEKFNIIERLYDHVFFKHAHEFPYFTCDICRKQFKGLINIRRHIAKVHCVNLYQFKCTKCNRKFMSSVSLTKHYDACTAKDTVYKCDICPMSYLNKFTLKTHMEGHTSERPFKCDLCEKTFKSESALRTHAKGHNVEKFACEFCPKTFSSRSKFLYRLHVSTHLTGLERPHKCLICLKSFPTKYSLAGHDKRKHSDTLPPKKLTPCTICNKNVHTSSLSKHMAIHREPEFQCDICQKKIRAKNNLVIHMDSHGFKDKTFMCDECGKLFHRKTHLKSHILQVHTKRVKAHECPKCKLLFYTPTEVRSHLLLHSEKRFKCDQCNKKFTSSRGLKIHMYKHEKNIDNVICDLCNKVYKGKDAMIKHLKVHRGSKHHRCEGCKKAFIDIPSLLLHKRTHKMEELKENTCRFCNKVFTYNLSLTRHLMSHHDGFREYGCNICEDTFLSLQVLSVHLTKEHKMPFRCIWCKNTYKQRTSLIKHIGKAHRGKQLTSKNMKK